MIGGGGEALRRTGAAIEAVMFLDPNQRMEHTTYFPSLLISPPSSTGISRLSPAPEAADPVVIVLPGNLLVTDSSIPDSVAR